MASLLLVLPLHAFQSENRVFVDDQARNGLRLWLENFDSVILACPTFDRSPPDNFLPIDDARVRFVALPAAYRPMQFAIALLKARPVLHQMIASSDYLHFAIGGLFGDWASACALIAKIKGRPFAVWTDRVESKVMAYQATSKPRLKRLYYSFTALATRYYERWIIGLGDIGLFHGKDCFEAYSKFSPSPHLVHNIHLRREHQISTIDVETRLRRTAPLQIAYAGRVHRNKGVFDWIEALSLAKKNGIDFNATWFGDGPEIEPARLRVEAEGLSDCIQFPGATANHLQLIERLRSFDIFMFCHKTPESPRCLVEALMCGLPLIGYQSPYPLDLTKKHGGGILSPMNRPELLSGSIRRFLEDKEQLTKKARLDGMQFDDESVFRHRSELMKSISSPERRLQFPHATPLRAH